MISDVLEGRATWAVVHGDCMEILPTLPAKSVAHAITDPPYEAEAHTQGRRLNGKASADGREVLEVPLSFSAITENERDRAAAEFGRLVERWSVVFSQVEAVNKWSRALVEGGANTKRIGIWVKPDAMPQFSGDRPGMGYESIVFAHAPGRSRWNGGGRVGVFTHNKNTPGGAHHHETQKPLPLMLELDEIERMRDLLADVREHLTRTWFSWHVQQSAATALLKRIDAVLEGRK